MPEKGYGSQVGSVSIVPVDPKTGKAIYPRAKKGPSKYPDSVKEMLHIWYMHIKFNPDGSIQHRWTCREMADNILSLFGTTISVSSIQSMATRMNATTGKSWKEEFDEMVASGIRSAELAIETGGDGQIPARITDVMIMKILQTQRVDVTLASLTSDILEKYLTNLKKRCDQGDAPSDKEVLVVKDINQMAYSRLERRAERALKSMKDKEGTDMGADETLAKKLGRVLDKVGERL